MDNPRTPTSFDDIHFVLSGDNGELCMLKTHNSDSNWTVEEAFQRHFGHGFDCKCKLNAEEEAWVAEKSQFVFGKAYDVISYDPFPLRNHVVTPIVTRTRICGVFRCIPNATCVFLPAILCPSDGKDSITSNAPKRRIPILAAPAAEGLSAASDRIPLVLSSVKREMKRELRDLLRSITREEVFKIEVCRSFPLSEGVTGYVCIIFVPAAKTKEIEMIPGTNIIDSKREYERRSLYIFAQQEESVSLVPIAAREEFHDTSEEDGGIRFEDGYGNDYEEKLYNSRFLLLPDLNGDGLPEVFIDSNVSTLFTIEKSGESASEPEFRARIVDTLYLGP
jgi:hypothetical protein